MDYLRECMESMGNPPLDFMQREFCLKCANRECDRAGMKNSAFDRRVRDWKSVLFDNVPRADPGDPRYDNIASKVFLPTSPQPPRATSVFMPGVPTIAEPQEGAAPVAPQQQQSPARFSPSPEVTEVAPEGLQPMPSPPEPRAVEAPAGAPGNTPFQQGAMLAGAPEQPPAPSAPPQETVQQQQAGTTFILEDD